MVQRILNAFGMQSCLSANNTLPHGFDMATNNSKVAHATLFILLIIALLQMAISVRLDIAFSAGHLSRAMHRSTNNLRKATKHSLKYRSEIMDSGVVFIADKKDINGDYSDADQSSELQTRNSIMGAELACTGGEIYWHS